MPESKIDLALLRSYGAQREEAFRLWLVVCNTSDNEVAEFGPVATKEQAEMLAAVVLLGWKSPEKTVTALDGSRWNLERCSIAWPDAYEDEELNVDWVQICSYLVGEPDLENVSCHASWKEALEAEGAVQLKETPVLEEVKALKLWQLVIYRSSGESAEYAPFASRDEALKFKIMLDEAVRTPTPVARMPGGKLWDLSALTRYGVVSIQVESYLAPASEIEGMTTEEFSLSYHLECESCYEVEESDAEAKQT
jgi:hypothetical protein